MRRSSFRLNEKTGHYSVIQPITKRDILDEARRILERSFARGSPVSEPRAAREYVIHKLSHLEHEVFACLFLDNRHRVLTWSEMFRGTINGASVHPREVVKAALGENAAAVIVAHNHPSGVPEPSQADIQLTRRLQDSLALVEVRLLDHLVVGGAEIESLAERGLI